ncbi:hypothetical protein CBS147353_10751 [Aspergillus niger]|nr:hypothetical protein CBS147353_10751 [Aspergillus niger]
MFAILMVIDPFGDQDLALVIGKTPSGSIPTVPYDDVIDGKGQGLNVLLKYVGKVSVADQDLRPNSCELVVDHGDSNALEQQLDAVFRITKHFNVMLLLDEADVFMEQRTSYHDTHNRLVAIFLRKLEYYQGVLFLTSNRGIQFDDAILSRIHFTINYEVLTRKFRRGLWSTFPSKARTMQGPDVVEEHDIRRLKSLAPNGREIKNIAAIAHAPAEADANQVSY